MGNLYFILWNTLLLLLFIASVTDLKARIIPNWLVIIGVVLGIAEHVAFQGVRGLIISLLGGIVWLVIGMTLWYAAKIGGGDVKLFAMIATFTGVTGVPDIVMVALIVQMIVYVIEFARGHMNLYKPFAPAIAMGSLALMLWPMIGRF